MTLSSIKPLYIKVLLSIIYFVGVIGLWLKPQDFIPLTPFNIGLTCLILMLYYPYKEKDFIRYCIFLFAAGFAIEMIGVQTGKIFGSYYYGSALGFKLKHVPIVIGLNWIMLTLTAQTIVFKKSNNIFISAALGALLMVLIDFLIEPIASKYEFWHWQNNQIPLQNFVAWFIVSFFFQGLGFVMKFDKENKMAVFIFCLQLIFFAVLNALNFLS